MHVTSSPPTKLPALVLTAIFSHRDAKDIIPREDDPMVVNLNSMIGILKEC